MVSISSAFISPLIFASITILSFSTISPSIETSERNGSVVGSFPVKEEELIILATDAGRIIRSPVNDIRIASRNTQGVTLFNVNEGESVVSVTKLSLTEEDEQIVGDEPQKDVEDLKKSQ